MYTSEQQAHHRDFLVLFEVPEPDHSINPEAVGSFPTLDDALTRTSNMNKIKLVVHRDDHMLSSLAEPTPTQCNYETFPRVEVTEEFWKRYQEVSEEFFNMSDEIYQLDWDTTGNDAEWIIECKGDDGEIIRIKCASKEGALDMVEQWSLDEFKITKINNKGE